MDPRREYATTSGSRPPQWPPPPLSTAAASPCAAARRDADRAFFFRARHFFLKFLAVCIHPGTHPPAWGWGRLSADPPPLARPAPARQFHPASFALSPVHPIHSRAGAPPAFAFWQTAKDSSCARLRDLARYWCRFAAAARLSRRAHQPLTTTFTQPPIRSVAHGCNDTGASLAGLVMVSSPSGAAADRRPACGSWPAGWLDLPPWSACAARYGCRSPSSSGLRGPSVSGQ